MRTDLRLLPFLMLTAALAFKLGVGSTSTAQAGAPAVNACGCYRDSAGSCYCGKKAGACTCPGECEPKGCEEKRIKAMEKEIEVEAKRAREIEKKQQDERAERERKENAPPPGEADDENDGAAEASKAGKENDYEDDDDKPKKKLSSKESGNKKKGKIEKASHKEKKAESAGSNG
ncbi:MAG TPA: hypothetical protein VHU40_11545 [Polyangia bacterium]|jgi:hypothetical protein|nr:hypothetical protein [Polyangia bacterium]